MHRFDLHAVMPTPWKDGGGTTQELACWPPGAAAGAFDWRISVARIERAGPFSTFEGVDRQIMLLGGDGVHLRGPAIDRRLDTPGQPFAFAGEAPVHCTLLGGASTDFNLMLRRGAWRGQIALVQEGAPGGSVPPAGLCLVLAGIWQGPDGRELTEGQGWWWCGGAPPAWPRPAPGAQGPGTLLRVAMHPCTL